MPEPLFACTPTRLGVWQHCPRRYRYTYLERPAPPRGAPWARACLGAAVHLALARWWSLPPAQRTPAGGRRLLGLAWSAEGYRDEQQSARVRELARGWVESYLHRLDPHDVPLGVERVLTARTARLALSGRVDRLDDRPGTGPVVVDYKTGPAPPGPADARDSLALALYAHAASRVLRRPVRQVELHHLPTGTVAVAVHEDGALQDRVAAAERLADQAASAQDRHRAGADPDEAFPARPGPGCSWCDFRRHCPPGRQAAPPLPSWAGLPELPELPERSAAGDRPDGLGALTPGRR